VTELRIDPEPTPAEAEAIRRALEALGLLEPAPAGGPGVTTGPGPALRGLAPVLREPRP
jgi:hypothetical protein